MIKIIKIILTKFFFLTLLLNSAEAISYKHKGKGNLSLSENTVDVLEFYFSGGKVGKYAEKQGSPWKPGLIVVSEDGNFYDLFTQPLSIQDHNIATGNYVGRAKKQCEKFAKEYNLPQKCYLFAVGRKIVWDNGSDKKRRKLKKSEISAGKTSQILQELNFYNVSLNNSSSSNTQSSDTSSNSDDDIVSKIKELQKLYEDGAITKDEFEKAKEKLLN
ncbi:SHOCT domain-containing protein [Candidatus Pelagibacter sp.]|nr:SHOCT domain-containing protein [Candidatus Pelagibacter sp.]